MMSNSNPNIIKSTGENVKFSLSKLKKSLLKSGATSTMVKAITSRIKDELYQGITTKEIYNRAFAMLRDYQGAYASRYALKKAIYELGPSGFPFEKFVARLLGFQGYQTQLNMTLPGKCINHEVDILAKRSELEHLVECKFHSEEDRNCDIKIPLYIYARFSDIYSYDPGKTYGDGWLITNTRFTGDAIKYGKCKHLKLMSWNYPEEKSLKEQIDRTCAYPVTSSTLLSSTEKHFLLDKGLIMASEIIDQQFLLDHLGISENRKKRILNELIVLCNLEERHEY